LFCHCNGRNKFESIFILQWQGDNSTLSRKTMLWCSHLLKELGLSRHFPIFHLLAAWLDGPHFPLRYHTLSYPLLVQKWMANLPSPLNYLCCSPFPFSSPQLLSSQKLKLLAEVPRCANSRVSVNRPGGGHDGYTYLQL